MWEEMWSDILLFGLYLLLLLGAISLKGSLGNQVVVVAVVARL